jgi:hypothetical protein
VFFDPTGFHRETDKMLFDAAARNAGWNDQRYELAMERPGRVKMVRVRSDSTFISAPHTLRCLPGDDGDQQPSFPSPRWASRQTGGQFQPLIEEAAGLPLRFAHPLHCGLRRPAHAGAVDATVNYMNTGRRTSRSGLPADSDQCPSRSSHGRTTSAYRWANAKGMLRAGWDGSWYDNQASTFVWDNPQRAVDAANASSQGRLAEWPSNNMFSVNVGGAYRMPRRTTLNGVFAFGHWNQN